MRKWITLLMMSLVIGSCASYANANTGEVTLEAGYRRDNIRWRERTPTRNPTETTSLKFKDLDIFQLGLQGRTTLGYNFYLRANAYWGWILDGDFENDVKKFTNNGYDNYESNGRVGQTFSSRTVVDDRFVYGAGAAIGYPFFFCDCTTIVAPVIGYAFDEQSVRLDNEGIDFGSEGYYCESIGNNNQCCRQTFNSRWYGPFVGVDFNYRPYNECWNFFVDLEYHWGSFRGRRSGEDENGRNVRSHEARGWVVGAGAEYDVYNCWVVGVDVKIQDWSANRHHRRRGGNGYNESGSPRSRNNDKWHSYAINLTVGREF